LPLLRWRSIRPIASPPSARAIRPQSSGRALSSLRRHRRGVSEAASVQSRPPLPQCNDTTRSVSATLGSRTFAKPSRSPPSGAGLHASTTWPQDRASGCPSKIFRIGAATRGFTSKSARGVDGTMLPCAPFSGGVPERRRVKPRSRRAQHDAGQDRLEDRRQERASAPRFWLSGCRRARRAHIARTG
jgi:hypothetical protein